MNRIVQLLGSLLLAVLLWAGSGAVASAHPGHHGPAQTSQPAVGKVATLTTFAFAEQAPAEDRHQAEHCVQFHCQVAPALGAARDTIGPVFSPRETLVPVSAAVPHGVIPDPPKRPPRIPS